MRKILFTEVEKNWLIDILGQRLKYHETHSCNDEKHRKNLSSALEKLGNNNPYFTVWEKTMCISCINEHLPSFYDQIGLYEEIALAIPPALLQEDHDKIDMGKDMLVKCGYKDNRYFPQYNLQKRFRDGNTLY